jgi:hypothetical protein
MSVTDGEGIMDHNKVIADYCRQVLKLAEARLSDPYFYMSLTLCMIDAVFSIRARYETTMSTVKRYCDCDFFKLTRYRANRECLPAISEQQSVSDFIRLVESKGADYFADKVFRNRQRTSSRNGILKSEAVLRFASALENYDVNYFQDIYKILSNDLFEDDIRKIPGQRSGISLKYFFMLAGSDDLIKPDMHIINFLKNAFRKKDIERPISLNDAQVLLSGATRILRIDYPHLTPRLLDNMIWSYQRKQRTPPRIDKEVMQVNHYLKPAIGRPSKGSVFMGKVNDLAQYDTGGWRRRDISLYKSDIITRCRSAYPSHGHTILLIDTAGNRYDINVTKPDNDYKVCLGSPGRLKAWYQLKGFDEDRVAPDTCVFVQYTGVENKFLILTQNEKNSIMKKVGDGDEMKTLRTWAGKGQFTYSGSVTRGTKINYGNRFSKTISASQYSELLKCFHDKTVDIGTSHTAPPANSLGDWLLRNVTTTGIASYVGPILISEQYAVKIGASQIKFIQKTGGMKENQLCADAYEKNKRGIVRYGALWKTVSQSQHSSLSPIHGLTHWRRVFENGLIIANETRANVDLVELFALFHDSCRLNDSKDPDHGRRAAEWVASMRSDFSNIPEDLFQYLLEALHDHTHVRHTDNIHIATCWDADRLDLGRVGTIPDPEYMNTEIGKKMLNMTGNKP